MEATLALIGESEFGPQAQARNLYEKLSMGGLARRAWSLLTGKPDTLLDIASLTKGKKVASSHYQGKKKVLISEIKGSEGRSADFDASFRPRRSHNRERWIGVASAFLKGIALPPVDLLKIGEVYVVRDGHHRISVAKACGASSVDAYVTVWNVS